MAINIVAGFSLTNNDPIDSRLIKADVAAALALPSYNRYEGLTIYITGENKDYRFVGGIEDANLVPLSASYALNGGSTGTSLTTGSTYPITASWATNAINWNSSSVVTLINTKQNTIATGSLLPVTSSWATNWNSSSVVTLINTKQNVITTGSTFNITSSRATTATNADTASVVKIYGTETDATFYVPFVTEIGADTATLNQLAGFTFNPNSQTLTTLNFVGTLEGTASSAVSATSASYATTCSFYQNYDVTIYKESSSFASSSISASYAKTASFWNSASVITLIGTKQNTIATGSLLPVTASWATNWNSSSVVTLIGTKQNAIATASLLPVTASWATNWNSASVITLIGTKQNTIATGSLVPFTSSWATNWDSSSVVTLIGTKQNIIATGSILPVTASWATNAITANTAAFWNSASVVTLINTKQNAIATASLLPVTASWATNWNSSSVVTLINTKQNTIATGSLLPVTASVAITASYALSGGSTGTSLTTGSTYPITASWATNATNWNSASVITLIGTKQNTIATGSLLPVTASWANNTAEASTGTGKIVRETSPTLTGVIGFEGGSTITEFTPDTNTLSIANEFSATPIILGVSDNTITATNFIGTASLATNVINAVFSSTQITGTLGVTQGITGQELHLGKTDNPMTPGRIYLWSEEKMDWLPIYAEDYDIIFDAPTTGVTVPNLTSNNRITAVSITASAGLQGTASWATNVVNGGSGTSLTTGSTYPITSSWAVTSSYLKGNNYNLIETKDNLVALKITGSSMLFGESAGTNAGVLDSTIIGRSAGTNATNANYATIIGMYAGTNATNANYATLIGRSAGYNATNATNATIIGRSAGYNATTASNATMLGYAAGYYATNATNATMIGFCAGYYATNATNATMIGYAAGQYAANAVNATMLGFYAGYNAKTGSNSIFIGYYADAQTTESNVANSIVIGYNQKVSTPNTTIIGNSSTTNIKLYGILDATGSLYGTSSRAVTASNADTTISSSYAATASFATTCSFYQNYDITIYRESSSFASSSISASYASTASFWNSASVITLIGTKQNTIATGSLLPVTSSWATNWNSASVITLIGTKQNTIATGSLLPVTASWAISASWAPSTSGTSLTTGSTYPITASWATNATNATKVYLTDLSSAEDTYYFIIGNATGYHDIGYNTGIYCDVLSNTFVAPTVSSTTVTATSVVASKITGSLQGTASWAINVVNGGSGTSLTTGSTYPITASWATTAVTANSLNGNLTTAQVTITDTGDDIDINCPTAEQLQFNNPNWDAPVLFSNNEITVGRLNGTASYADRALSASYAPGGTEGASTGTGDLVRQSGSRMYWNNTIIEEVASGFHVYDFNTDTEVFDINNGNVRMTGDIQLLTEEAFKVLYTDGNGFIKSSDITITDLAGVSSSYETLTIGASNGITCSFGHTNEVLTVPTGAAFTFTSSNTPTGNTVKELDLFIDNQSTLTSSFTFPTGWKWMGSKPTYMTSSKSALLSLKAFGPTVLASFVPEL